MYARDRDHGRVHVHNHDRLERCMNLARGLVHVRSRGHHARQRGGEESCR
jgi:hypothetical protein